MSQTASVQLAATDPETLWLQHQDIIRHLYITENKTLREVKDAMEAGHRFPVMRLHDYEVALRELLKLRKNLKGNDWYVVGVQISDRKRQGKESEVVWNKRRLAPKKVRKEVLRNCKANRLGPLRGKTVEFPAGLVIRTPPSSPGGETDIKTLPSVMLQSSEPAILGPSSGDTSTCLMGQRALDAQNAIQCHEAAQRRVLMLRQFRENVPFNRFMLEMLDVSKSQPLLLLIPAGPARTPVPRLFGCNPSLELLARVSFELSNKLWIDWRANYSSWFLDWLGVSADHAVLKIFFSPKTPTVCAVYEGLCRMVNNLRRPATIHVLFEIQDDVTKNNPVAVNGVDFLKRAVHIGSNADGMLDVAKRAFERWCIIPEYATDAQIRRWHFMFLAAAARRDIAMMRLLIDTVARLKKSAFLAGDSAIRLLPSVMRQLYDCDFDNPEEANTIVDYVQLLIRGGILVTVLPVRCCYDDRAEVAICYPDVLTIDEVVMICPPSRRTSLYTVFLRCISEYSSFVSNAGVFTAALKGAHNLETYLQSCERNNCFEICVTMQESLLFATCLNDIETVSVLLQLGVDPDVGLLSNNHEHYNRGDVGWNPMVVAAAAGNLEILGLLRERASLVDFLRAAPIHEIVQFENAQERYGRITGRELRRLENLRRHYLYSRTRNPDAEIADAMLHMHSNHPGGRAFAHNIKLMATDAAFFTTEKRRLETLTWIRNTARAHDVGPRIDEDILEAAIFNDPEIRALQCGSAAYQPCDVLLLDGLVETNPEYHQDDMDLLQLSIRAQCSFKVVEFLISKGYYVHSRPAAQSGNTMLHDAILSNSCDRAKIVQLLLREGADYKYCGAGLTILEASLHRKAFSMEQGPFPEDVEMFERLFEAGAPVRHWPRPELERRRPLIFLLLEIGAPDDLILRVVDAGGDLDERGWDNCIAGGNKTPLQKAISRGRETLAQELIQRGANVHAHADRMFGSTALQAACMSHISLKFVEHLIEVQGADVNEIPSEICGTTALQGAASRGSLSLAEVLLAHGADVNALSGRFGSIPGRKRSLRRRALDFAAMMGRLDVTEFLLKAGGRSGTAGLGEAMQIAEENCHFAVLSVLLEWQKEHGSRIIREEAEWQQQNPELARLLSEDDYSDESDSDSSVEGDCDD